MKRAALAVLMPTLILAANYQAETTTREGIEVVRLVDAPHKTEVSIVPSIGNNAYEMSVNGKNVFWTPYKHLEEFKKKPVLLGNPFLAPWANRLDQDAFWANGKKYTLNPALNNVRHDGFGQPIHGLLAFSPHWELVEVKADNSSAMAKSRLEFWKHPDLMQQFPFAHAIEMTYRLQDGVLEVETAIRNLSTEPMPVSTGYHPYFTLHDAPRDEWKVRLPVRQRMALSKTLVPTGELEPLPQPGSMSLEGVQLDDVFTGLIRGESGRAEFTVEGKREKIAVLYGPKYTVAVVYAPKGRDFICFEPMSGPTNAFNMAHAGTYKDLQTIAPGGEWRESYWIQPSGF
ncbi:MAG: aldose 1-epimerase [Bryobacteraceae bacterium]